jgi:methylmalonyl-CoA/ethylmalonyl-CoA epimerase
MGPTRIDHLGIAVQDLDAAVTTYRTALGFSLRRREVLVERGIEVAFFQAGPDRIELIAATRSDSEISRFLQKRGEGLHHLCLTVENIDAALAEMKAAGVRLIDQAPRPGADGRRAAFVHPASCHGVLIELVEKGPPKEDRDG